MQSVYLDITCIAPKSEYVSIDIDGGGVVWIELPTKAPVLTTIRIRQADVLRDNIESAWLQMNTISIDHESAKIIVDSKRLVATLRAKDISFSKE